MSCAIIWVYIFGSGNPYNQPVTSHSQVSTGTSWHFLWDLKWARCRGCQILRYQKFLVDNFVNELPAYRFVFWDRRGRVTQSPNFFGGVLKNIWNLDRVWVRFRCVFSVRHPLLWYPRVHSRSPVPCSSGGEPNLVDFQWKMDEKGPLFWVSVNLGELQKWLIHVGGITVQTFCVKCVLERKC